MAKANNKDKNELDELFSIKETANTLGLSQRNVRHLVYNRKISHVRLGRRVLIPISSIKSLIQDSTIPAV